MQIHQLLLPTKPLTPLTFSHIPPFHHSKLQRKFNWEHWFCKRVSLSLTNRSPCGCLVVVKCGDKMGSDKDDSFYMRRCVEVARKAIGCTSPNPMVGCVIVKDGNIVGEGFHPKAGQPHAEVFALRDAGDLAEHATAYVSLEPCNHFGRTPPCTEALIKANVKKVVVGMVDPNPIVASKGVDKLRDAGIDVVVGVEEQLCKRLNEAYIHRMLTGNPFVTLRYSISVNGHLLDQLGERVTERGGYYSELLQEYDAVIFSASLIGNFSLPASQEPGANQPLYIITGKGASSFSLQTTTLREVAGSKMIVFTDKEGNVQPETAQKGIESVSMDRISLNAILEYCKEQGLCSVMLDVRGNSSEFEELLSDAIVQNMVQKIIVEVLPVWEQSSNLKSLAALKIAGRRLKVNNLQPRASGQSVVLEGYL